MGKMAAVDQRLHRMGPAPQAAEKAAAQVVVARAAAPLQEQAVRVVPAQAGQAVAPEPVAAPELAVVPVASVPAWAGRVERAAVPVWAGRVETVVVPARAAVHSGCWNRGSSSRISLSADPG